MDVLSERIVEFFTGETGRMVLRALAVLIVGTVVARLLRSAIRRLMSRRMSEDHSAVVSRLSFTLMLAVVVLISLHQLGFDLSVLLGAAGILTVALGFASQTSASNLISGIFLLGERPFVVGDLINVGQTTGEVVSVDLLSVKIRTFDNLFVRVPNETLLKTEITTLTRFPIRRVDLELRISYEADLEQVRRLLIDVADQDPLCLDEPEPNLFFKRFGEVGQELQFSVWVVRENYIKVKNGLPRSLLRALAEAGVEIALPRRVLSATEPLPVQLKSEDGPGGDDGEL